MTNNNHTEVTQKSLWKGTVLEYLHNCLIGISNLECSEANCPLVYNWNDLERTLSKKGKAALYKIGQAKWTVVELISYQTNDLGTYENIEIKFKSGKTQKTKPKVSQLAKNTLQKSGYNPEKEFQIYLKEDEYVLFFNNYAHTPNLLNAESIYLEDLWKIKQNIKWDREKSKKKVFLFTENEPSEQTQAENIDASNKDYLFYIADPSITNSIKNYEVYNPGTVGHVERARLYEDYKEEFSELRRFYGIRHLTSKKEDRQNNPEVELNEAQFIALERDKKRERMKAIKDFEQNIKGCIGEHTLIYGTAPEQREEKVQELEDMKMIQIRELEQNTETFSKDKEQSTSALYSKDKDRELKERKKIEKEESKSAFLNKHK